MDNQIPNIRSRTCQKHNELIRYYDKVNRNPLCYVCIAEKADIISVEQIQKQYQEIIINDNKENDLELKQLYTLKDGILKYKESIINSLNNSIQQIIEQIKSIQSQKQSMQQLDYIMNKYESIDDLTTYLSDYQKSNRQFRNEILINLLLGFKSNIMKIDFLHSIIGERKILINSIGVVDKQKSSQKIVYELIQIIESKECIKCFAFDKQNNALIVGMTNGMIKIYDFQNGKVGGEISIIQAHTSSLSCLSCMKKRHSFVSGGFDCSIKIWCLDEVNNWKAQQTLNGNKNDICCMIMNQKEDLLISGSKNTLKFWIKQNDCWSFSQAEYCFNQVQACSLNENEDKLIVSLGCSEFSEIRVMNIQNNQKWKQVQTIKVYSEVYQLCFTIQDQFAFQPVNSDQLKIYDFDKTQVQFCEKSKVRVQGFRDCPNQFPCLYIKKLDMLTVKHDIFVNIFKVNQNGEYQLIQTIEYQNQKIFGRMTDDGRNLITWDEESKEIQVRQLKLKQELS